MVDKLILYKRWIFIAGLLLWALGILLNDQLPQPNEVDANLLNPPHQQETEVLPFQKEYDGKQYTIIPRYEYELYGLVVSTRDLEHTWYNIAYDQDPMNIKDVCVLWGGNLASHDFQSVEFHSGLWTCYARYQGALYFDDKAISNNHILPDDLYVARVLSQVGIGDQIYLKGYLVDYHVDGREGLRKTSTTREDTGNGACEVIYLKEIRILKDANQIQYFTIILGKGLIVLSVLLLGFELFLFQLKMKSGI